jgi:hypothetical protein
MSDQHQYGDAPVEERFRATMTAVVRTLDGIFNGDKRGKDRDVGFILMVFPFSSDSGRCNYMSNGADRVDVVKLMKEQIARFEAQQQ